MVESKLYELKKIWITIVFIYPSLGAWRGLHLVIFSFFKQWTRLVVISVVRPWRLGPKLKTHAMSYRENCKSKHFWDFLSQVAISPNLFHFHSPSLKKTTPLLQFSSLCSCCSSLRFLFGYVCFRSKTEQLLSSSDYNIDIFFFKTLKFCSLFRLKMSWVWRHQKLSKPRQRS